jgi:predicted O-linked N-acetylglucosamine transferase (SPINDLY family)
MTAVDYRLTDPYLDPLGADESAYSERSVRLPRTYWCYQPLDTLEPGPLPAETTGAICFASFNNFCKTSPAVWEVWTRVLQAVPGSRLVVASPFGSHRQRFRQVLVAAGVNPDRLSFAPIVSPREYFQNYQRVDIALDPFPYGGGTTTCDALWMGVPVITLRGSTAVGRAGASILSNAGLPELIAGTVEDFIAIAKQLAEDIPRLSRLRRDLRPQLRQSPLMDAAGFARDVEEAFRRMWIDWCKGESHG